MRDEVVPDMAEAIEARMAALKITPTDLAERTGLSLPGLAPVRKGYRRNYRAQLRWALCAALRWTPDSVDRLLRGEPAVELDAEEPEATPPAGDADVRASVDEALAAMGASIASLRDQADASDQRIAHLTDAIVQREQFLDALAQRVAALEPPRPPPSTRRAP